MLCVCGGQAIGLFLVVEFASDFLSYCTPFVGKVDGIILEMEGRDGGVIQNTSHLMSYFVVSKSGKAVSDPSRSFGSGGCRLQR